MRPTRTSVLAVVGAIAVVLGAVVADLVDKMWGRSLPVPWSSALTMIALALVVAGWAWSFRRRLRNEHERVDPFVAVRTAALAMAASRAGAITAGLFAGVGLWYAADLASPAARERAVICAVGVVASLALVIAALWLERMCRLPEGDDDGAPGGPSGADDSGADWVHPHLTR